MTPELEGVVVWTIRQDEAAVQARLPAYEKVLTVDERQRSQRFAQDADRVRFVLGRTLARLMLSHFWPLAARDWPIVIDERGRPELGARPDGAPDLRFNLSHTPGLVACAITIGREVGVDVEHVARQVTHPNIPERFFSPREVDDLRALPGDQQATVFFDYWTLKESYIKARGLGLALPLGQFTFLRTPGAAPTITFAPELDDDPDSWQFAQYWPTDAHRMAVAVRRRGPDVPIHVLDVVPEVAE